MKKIKLFALAVMAMLGINAMAADKTVKYSANGLDYDVTYAEGTPNTPVKAVVVGLTTGNTTATSVTIPATITPTGTGADANITGLEFDVKEIKADAFYLKSTLATVTISGEKLTTIGGRAFQGTAVASIALPKTVTTIGQGAFKNTQLATFTWAPTAASTIADSAFVNTQLTTFTVPAKVTSLGATNGYVFAESAKLATLTLAASSELATLKANIIKGTAITELDLSPAAANLVQANIADKAFASEKLQKVIFYTKSGSTVTQNSTIATIADGWFEESYALQEVVFPTTVTAIEAKAFQNCVLTTLDLSKSTAAVTLANIFNAKKTAPYSTLTSIALPNLKEQTIAANAFAFCTGLTTVTFPTKWEQATTSQVAGDAFKGCTGLTGVTFKPAKTTGWATTTGNAAVFANDAFSDCTPTITIATIAAYSSVWTPAPTNTTYGEYVNEGVEITLTDGLAMLARNKAYMVAPADAVVYQVYIDDDADGTIYMVPFKIKGGYYQVAAGNYPVLIKAKNASATKLTIYEDDGITTSSAWAVSALKRTGDAVTAVSTLATATEFVNVAVISDGVFGFTSPSGSTLAAKTYYVLSKKQYGASAARIVWMDEDSDMTAIKSVKSATEDGAVYNLAGQQVDANYKGIVIKNGKKMIQK